MTDAKPRFPIGLTVATAVALAILVALGVWQLERRAWKEDLLARIAALQAAPARPLGGALSTAKTPEDLGFMRVSAICPGLETAPFLQLYSLRGGEAGVRLISACPLGDGRSILVDRGFVADTISARPPVDSARLTPMRVEGVLRAPDAATFVTPANQPNANQWYSRDIAAMAQHLGAANPAPVFLMAETSSNPEWKALIPAPLPTEIPNRHLEYAGTWFGLAGALAAVYAALLFRRLKS
jgi:surfeit locus 1 family protein